MNGTCWKLGSFWEIASLLVSLRPFCFASIHLFLAPRLALDRSCWDHVWSIVWQKSARNSLTRSSWKSVHFWQSAAASFLQLAPKSHNRKAGSALSPCAISSSVLHEATCCSMPMTPANTLQNTSLCQTLYLSQQSSLHTHDQQDNTEKFPSSLANQPLSQLLHQCGSSLLI